MPVSSLRTRPHTNVVAHEPDGSGRLYSTEAVCRHWLPGSSTSGCSRRPTLYCAVQFRAGAILARVDHESNAPGCMPQRRSLGSRPLNADASTFSQWITRPVVTTPKLVWVESCK